MTNKTLIAELQSMPQAEFDKLGFVTDNNSGGYYLAECDNCGAIFPSQQSDGGQQIAETGDYDDCLCQHCGHVDPEECYNANLAWNVQQLKIINLTSQLEATEARIAEQQAAIGKLNGTIARLSEDKSQFALIINSNYNAAQIQKADLEARITELEKYASERDSENESLMLTVGRLRVKIEELTARNALVAGGIEAAVKLQERAEKAEAELARLKGDAVPVAWTDEEELRDMEKYGHAYLFKAGLTPHEDPRRMIKLFTHAQPMPVVVLPSKVNVKMGGDKSTRSMLSGMNMMLKDCQKAIELAGITVKSADGEGD